MRTMRSERGVAMIIVLLVGASLTAVSSVATFAMIREFGASDDDRRSAQAFAVAEAGIDRFLAYLKSGKVTYGLLNQAGCAKPPLALPQGSVGAGTYSASITVYNPAVTGAAQLPPTACSSRPTRPVLGQDNAGNTYFVITSRGTFAAATKVIRQVISLQPIGLPVGIYGRSITVQSANHSFPTVSMISETTIQNRSDLQFTGLDPWYVMRNVYPDPTDPLLANVAGAGAIDPAPAAAHAAGQIFLGNARDPEYPPTKNCTANGKGGTAAAVRAQSIWDSDGSSGSGTITSGCDAWPGYSPVAGGAGVYPKSSKFTTDQLATFASPRLTEEDYQTLKDAAKTYGVYCSFPGADDPAGLSTCIRAGTTVTGAAADYFGLVKQLADGGEKNVLGYVEFRTGAASANNVFKTADLGASTVYGCNTDPELSKSLVTIVRRGGVNYDGAGGDRINGAFVIDGNWSSNGAFTFNGSLIVQGNLHFQSSAQTYSLDTCWVSNTPGPFFRVVPGAWSEIDR